GLEDLERLELALGDPRALEPAQRGRELLLSALLDLRVGGRGEAEARVLDDGVGEAEVHPLEALELAGELDERLLVQLAIGVEPCGPALLYPLGEDRPDARPFDLWHLDTTGDALEDELELVHREVAREHDEGDGEALVEAEPPHHAHE